MAVTVKELQLLIKNMCEIIIENEQYFCELDSAAGDGDFGMSLAKGFREVQKREDSISADSMQTYLRECGMIITEFCGGASGPIWGTAFRSAAMATKDKAELSVSDAADVLLAAIAGIQKRGGAKRGDKTLLDALIPAAETVRECAGQGLSMREAFVKAGISAKEGAEETKNYSATKGRASYVGDRSVSYPDAGAVAISVIIEELIRRI